MKKKLSRLLALALAAALTLSGCSSGTTEEPESSAEAPSSAAQEEQESQGEAIEDLVIARLSTAEMQTFNILYSQTMEDFANLCNMVDSLMEIDNYSRIVPCIAESYTTNEDKSVWTFQIRDGVKWVDVNGNEKADCTSQDFATAMEWILNFHKNKSSQTSDFLIMLEGANEYYEYTKTLSEEEAFALTAEEGSVFKEMVGVETPDANTLIYRCIGSRPYWDSLSTCLWPMSQAMVDELGGPAGVKAMNNENMWYNGCYTMTSYVQGNEKIFTKNPLYWDQDCELFNTVTVKMVESNDTMYQLYQSGEIDTVTLTESNLKTIYDDPENPYHDYLVENPATGTYQIHFNYDKHLEDGTPDVNWNTAIANEAFRLSWYYGLDLTEYWKRTNSINPLSCENEFYSMTGLAYTSDGTDYTELVRQELGLPEIDGQTVARLDADKAEQYKQQAIEELTALGVTFPVQIDFFISGGNQTALDTANVLSQCFSDSLGDDYVQFNINTYVSSASQEVYTPKLQSFVFNGWTPGVNDPTNYLDTVLYDAVNAYYSDTYSNIVDVEETETTKDLIDTYKEFTAMAEEAKAINDDMDARYQACAEAEAYLISHALVLPAYHSSSWCLTKINPYSKIHAPFGGLNEKMKNWETNADGYTTAEIEAIKAEYEAAQ
mgnify:FL=1